MSDILKSYENGMHRLLEAMGKDHQDYLEALTLQIRLQENIERAQQFGDTDARSANRIEILYQLTKLAMQVTGKSFLELCGSELPTDEAKLHVNESKLHSDPNRLRKILEDQRKKLIEIEKIFDRPGPRKFTEGSISRLEADLQDMLISIRNTPDKTVEDCIKATDCVLKNLRGACDLVSISLDLIKENRRTFRYYKSLRLCQEHLVNALTCW